MQQCCFNDVLQNSIFTSKGLNRSTLSVVSFIQHFLSVYKKTALERAAEQLILIFYYQLV